MAVRIAHKNKKIAVSIGEPQNLGRSENKTLTIQKFIELFGSPVVTPEKHHEYVKMSDAKQRRLKVRGGWFLRAPVEKGVRNRHSILASYLVTLDVDYATPEYLELLLSGGVLPGYTLMAHTSRSHTPEKPRIRIMVFLKDKVDADRYSVVSRIIAQMADPNMEHIDKVSFRPAQMMYMPTCSTDMQKHYVHYVQDGDLLDAEKEVSRWERKNGSSTDLANLPRAPGEDNLREVADKAEDPLTKDGPVGDFCRAYSISELLYGKDGEPGILADTYEVVEEDASGILRMTYAHGSTSNGAVVYEDKFVFSHHGSDPAQEQLCNAFDLVRIHKFDDEDKAVDHDTPMNKRPSWKAMIELLNGDEHYREQQAESRYDMDAKFDDDDVDWDEEEPDEDEDDGLPSADDILGMSLDAATASAHELRVRSERAEKPPRKWIAKELELDQNGQIKATLHNMATIITNDPRFWRKIRYNLFNYQIVATDDIISKTRIVPDFFCDDKVNGDRWQEINDIVVRAMIAGPAGKGKPGYGLAAGKEMVHDAIVMAARTNQFHPVREYLDRCTTRKKPRDTEAAETVLIRYFGAEDTPYTRMVSKMMMIASVARIEEPGCKFDNAIILEGPQGIGKSTGIKRLYGKEYFGEIDVDLKDRKQIAEQIAGKWVNELPELSAMHKSDHNDAKAFMSRQDDDVRLSYDRNVSTLPRQCVFWGSTNDQSYLRDATGNRRYWPVECTQIDVIGLMEARDSIWQDAALLYREMRAAHPHGELPLFLTGEAAATAKRLQESRRKTEMWESWFQTVSDWMDEPLTLHMMLKELDIQSEDHDNAGVLIYNGYDVDQTMVQRIAFRATEAKEDALGMMSATDTNNITDMTWKRVLAEFESLGWGHNQSRIGRMKGRWTLRPDITVSERRQGFRVVLSPDGPPTSKGQVDDDFTDEDVEDDGADLI